MKFSGPTLAFGLWAAAVLADDTVMEIIELGNRPAAEIQALLQPLLNGDDRIVADGAKLIVKTAPAKLAEIRALVKQLDGPVRNFTISVLQTTSQTAEQLNAEAAATLHPERVELRGLAGNTEDLRGQRQQQQVRATEGQPAFIKTGEIKPVRNVAVYGSNYGGAVLSSTQMLEASSGFAVVPRLAGDDQVTLAISPWSNQFQNGEIATQAVQTTLRAKLGEWIEIAGNADQTQSSGAGMTGFNQSTETQTTRILIRVDIAK